jgi:succinyl-CoA synthetase alpha subunit
MAILLDQDTKILFQGLTGPTATRMAERAISNGNQVVGGVRPGKGGSRHLGLPIFDTVQQAVAEVSPDATAVFVPPQKAADAMIEAIEAEVPLIVCVTERIAVQDMLRVREALNGSNSKLVGPNSYGVICPGLCRIGVMPDRPHQEGSVGIVSRSATLAYLAVEQTSRLGLGQSTSVGIGGDPVHGLGFADCLSLFAEDPKTKAVVLIGEVGGKEEEQAAAFLKERKIDKPVIAFVAGRHAPPGRRMGHAGTMNFYGGGSVADKIALLKDSGAIIAENPSLIGRAVFRELQ